MKRIMPFLLLAAAAAPAFAAERRFTLSDFDRIQVEGPYEVVVATGKAPSALASGSAAAVEGVSMDVQGRVLKIRPNRSTWGGYPGEKTAAPRLTLTAHGLRAASVTGSGRLTIDKAKAMRFDAAVSGSGQIVLGNIEADNLVIGLLGSGAIEIGGQVKSLRATIQGSGDLNGQALTAQDAVINAETSGRVDLAVRGAAKIRAIGQGETLVRGGAACTVEALGSGLVLCGD